jgi:hypothetical protein
MCKAPLRAPGSGRAMVEVRGFAMANILKTATKWHCMQISVGIK